MKVLVAILLVPLAAQATLTPSIPRGEALVQIPSRNANEICVIPTHLSAVTYSKGDRDAEQGLCQMQNDRNVAICPKVSSTNPGIEWFEVPAGYTAQQVEDNACFIANPKDRKDNVLKKLAKYKGSTSCSYTPSILGYYHVSRILGGVGIVPPAVLRTFDLERHLEIAQLGLATAKKKFGASAPIAQTWGSLLNFLNAGSSWSKRDSLFTDAFDQSYGALQVNPRNEEKYGAFFNAARGSGTRADAFRDYNPTFANVRSSHPVSSFASSSFSAANVQAVVAMKDASDLAIIDTLMSQEDRFGNVHDVVRYAYLKPDQNGSMSVKFENKMKPEEIAATHAIQVKQMLLKDNDCGVSRANRALKAGLVAAIAHVDPTTYQGVLYFDSIADDPSVIKSFKSGMMFTNLDYATMRANLKSVAKTLKSKCVSGALKLDLDIDGIFAGSPAPTSCDLIPKMGASL